MNDTKIQQTNENPNKIQKLENKNSENKKRKLNNTKIQQTNENRNKIQKLDFSKNKSCISKNKSRK